MGKRGKGNSRMRFIKQACRHALMQTNFELKRTVADGYQWRGIVWAPAKRNYICTSGEELSEYFMTSLGAKYLIISEHVEPDSTNT